MPLPSRPKGPIAPTRETIIAPAPVDTPTPGQVDKSPEGKIPTYSVRGVDPALALAIKHLALDRGLTMREIQEEMIREMLHKYGREAPDGR